MVSFTLQVQHDDSLLLQVQSAVHLYQNGYAKIANL